MKSRAPHRLGWRNSNRILQIEGTTETKSKLRHFQSSIFARHHFRHRLMNCSGRCQKPTQIIGRKLENPYAPSGHVLLVSQILIRRYKQIELRFGESQKLPIRVSASASESSSRAIMTRKYLPQWPRHTFVEHDPHTVVASIADSDRFSSWHAICRLTVGKHSRNSSSV